MEYVPLSFISAIPFQTAVEFWVRQKENPLAGVTLQPPVSLTVTHFQLMKKTQGNREAGNGIWMIPLRSEVLLRNPLDPEVPPTMITFAVLLYLTPQDLCFSLRPEEPETSLLSLGAAPINGSFLCLITHPPALVLPLSQG